MRSIDSYPSLVALLDQALTTHADRVACVSMGREMTYRELDQLSRQWAGWLQSLALPAKSRVAIMLPNVAASLVCLLGTLRTGHLVVNVNPLYTPRELGTQLKDCEADVIVVFEVFAHVLEEVDPACQPKQVVVVSPGALQPLPKRWLINWVAKHIKKRVPAWRLPSAISFENALSVGHQTPFDPPHLLPDDVAILQYTGGTTGEPRGAMLTHRNMVANILQVEAIAEPVLRDILPRPLTMLTALPLYHVFAMTVCALYALHAGMRVVLVINPRDLPALIALWKKESPHVFPAVNTLFAALLRQETFEQLDFSGLRIALGGGMAVHPTVAQQWQAVTGRTIVEGYGMSETSPVISANPTDSTIFSATVGLPLPQTTVLIVDDEQRPVADGEVGEIAVKGPQVMQGYWRAPAATAAAMTDDGFLLTGDMGLRDAQGYIKIVDRKKDMVVVSGFNVYPAEVDQVFAAHPAVIDCAAVGVADDVTGHAIRLFVVANRSLNNGLDDLDEKALKEWGRAHLTGYKCPKTIVFVDSLPKNTVGKTLRRLLVENASVDTVGQT